MMRFVLAAATVVIGLSAIFVFATNYGDVGSQQSFVLESPRPSSSTPARTEPAAARTEPTPAPAPVAAAPSGVELPPVTAVRANTRLAIGRISSNVPKHWPRLEAMANYLAAELAPYGVTGVDIKMVDTMEEMQELLVAGEVDLVSETAFAAIELTRSGSADMLLREWKSGVSDYHTVIFARRDSGIESLDDLVGRTIAFEDRGSTSAYLVPRAHMAQEGFNLVELDDPLARPPRGSVGYTFADDESNVVGRVMRGYADAGVMSNHDWSDEDEVSEVERRDLVLIESTDPIIRSIMLVRNSLDPDVKSLIAAVLQQMHESEAGLETLREYWKVARFDRIEGPALENLLTARALHETFRSF